MTPAPARTGIRQVVDAAALELTKAGIGSPRVDAELLAAHAAGTERGRLAFVDPDPGFGDRYRRLVSERARRVPLQHLTGTAAFGPVTLRVGPGVFIPRPETESLLEWALAQQLSSRSVIVDLCTGSGALALALAGQWPAATVFAVDDSAEALAYARDNVAATGVELIHADVTRPGLRPDLDGRVDLIVANPPYIPDGAQLEPEVAAFDPAHALFGGPDGMAVIEPIVDLAARWLVEGGRCAIEHDDTTSANVIETFQRTRVFTDVIRRDDLAGRPRFVTAVRDGRLAS